jgi:Type I phosphodiesterase / nucleotide pyrophosphatase
MTLDDLVLAVQHLLDRIVRRIRVGRAPEAGGRRLLIVQIDGLSRVALEQALAAGFMPFLKRMLDKGVFRMQPMAVGLPTSTPAFQMAAMYGVQPDIPGFHYHDKRRREDVYFPRAGDAALVEAQQAGGRVGIVSGGSTYGCVFTGGAPNNLFSFAQIKRPSGKGVLRVLSALFVLLWVVIKSLVLSVYELLRALLRFIADPVGESRRGWKWLAIKIGLSVWLRELFTLAVSRDIYMGVPAVYVNYLDYDVFSHAYGPRHRRTLRSLRHVDHSLHQLWRVCRRVPGYGYDLYVIADHGQTHCTPYVELTGGTPVERRLFDEFFDPAHAENTPGRRGRRLAAAFTAFRSGHAPGVIQRFINYLEDPGDFNEVKEARERNGVRVIAAGPNAFVYFVDDPNPLLLDQIEERFPGLAENLSRSQGIGLVFARTADGPVCFWRGKRYGLDELPAGPFEGREDADIIRDGIRDLMAMPSAGDLVLYGLDSAQGNVSYIGETGAHAGPSFEELHTFIIAPTGVRVPASIVHPLQLYPHFIQYQEARRNAA